MKKSITVVSIFLIFLTVIPIYYWNLNSGKATAIQAIEEIRKEKFVEYVIHEDVDSSGMYMYFLRDVDSVSPSLSVEYVKKTRNGKWKWVYGGGHTIGQRSLVEQDDGSGVPISYQYLQAVEEKRFRIPHPVIFGGISDPDISRIVVKDHQTGLERQVNIIPVHALFRFYYVNLTKTQGVKFQLIAFNAKNEVVFEETYDEEIQGWGSAGIRQK